MALVSLSSGFSQLRAHLFGCLSSFCRLEKGMCRRCCLARVALPFVVMQVVDLQGYGGAARLCRRCTLVRAERVVLLRSLSSVPLTFLATSRYRVSSICFVQLVSLLIPVSSSGALALLFLSWL